MYKDRLDNYKKLEERRSSKLLVYITGDRPNLETKIHAEVLSYFGDHLDAMGMPEKISLLLYTRGGNTLAGYGIVNLIRQFCKKFEVVVPAKAHSTGTIICLGADSILMTKQASLGPIDPSVNTPLNPQVPGGSPHARVPVSVEAIKGYIDLIKNESNIKDESNLTSILLKLSDKIHPLVLGEAYRAKAQIQNLARNLLKYQVSDEEKKDKIISFLCSDSGSHDYSINRREAKNDLGLEVEKPDDSLYTIIRDIFNDIRDELELNDIYDPKIELGANQQKNYIFRRCLVESIASGSEVFVSKGTLIKKSITIPPGIQQELVEDQRQFEGWEKQK